MEVGALVASVSDRSLFLEAAKQQAMTINQIVETFNVAPNTARVWVKHENIEQVDGSWPPTYRHKNTFAESVPVVEKPVKAKPNTYSLEVPKPPLPAIESFFGAVMDGEAPLFNFNQEFQGVSSRKQLAEVRSKLISCLIIVEYYDDIMKNEGID